MFGEIDKVIRDLVVNFKECIEKDYEIGSRGKWG